MSGSDKNYILQNLDKLNDLIRHEIDSFNPKIKEYSSLYDAYNKLISDLEDMYLSKQMLIEFECKKDIAYIPDNPDVYENLTGFQYVNFVSDLYEVAKNVREEKLDYFSNLFEMKSFLNNTISSYSHGMKQKIVIISALIHSPKLLVMDEPFVGLDPKSSYLLKEEMRKLARNGGAIFFSTHVLEVAEKLCNKIAMLDNGHLIFEGKTTEILKNSDGLEQYFMEMIKK